MKAVVLIRVFLAVPIVLSGLHMLAVVLPVLGVLSILALDRAIFILVIVLRGLANPSRRSRNGLRDRPIRIGVLMRQSTRRSIRFTFLGSQTTRFLVIQASIPSIRSRQLLVILYHRIFLQALSGLRFRQMHLLASICSSCGSKASASAMANLQFRNMKPILTMASMLVNNLIRDFLAAVVLRMLAIGLLELLLPRVLRSLDSHFRDRRLAPASLPSRLRLERLRLNRSVNTGMIAAG